MSHSIDFHPTKRPRRLHNVPAGVMVAVERADGRLINQSDLDRIEQLDDVIFSALGGDAAALDRSAKLWRELQRVAPPALLEESREQYLRQAQAICDRYFDDPARALGRMFAATEILALLAE